MLTAINQERNTVRLPSPPSLFCEDLGSGVFDSLADALRKRAGKSLAHRRVRSRARRRKTIEACSLAGLDEFVGPRVNVVLAGERLMWIFRPTHDYMS